MWPTPADLERRLRTTFTLDEHAVAEQILAAIVGRVRSATGQHLDFVEDDVVVLRGRGSSLLLLPELPVVDVVTVAVNDEPFTDFDFDGESGELRTAGGWFGQVTVTYDHGFDPIPADLVGLVLDAAERQWRTPQGVSQEGLGAYQVTYNALTAAEFSAGDRMTLDLYKQREQPS